MSDYEYRPFSWEALDVVQVDGDGVAEVRGPGTVQWNIPTIEKPVYHLPGDNMTSFTVRVPEQFFDYDIPEAEWNDAIRTGKLIDTVDRYVTDMPIKEELYGPDGQQVGGW